MWQDKRMGNPKEAILIRVVETPKKAPVFIIALDAKKNPGHVTNMTGISTNPPSLSREERSPMELFVPVRIPVQTLCDPKEPDKLAPVSVVIPAFCGLRKPFRIAKRRFLRES